VYTSSAKCWQFAVSWFNGLHRMAKGPTIQRTKSETVIVGLPGRPPNSTRMFCTTGRCGVSSRASPVARYDEAW